MAMRISELGPVVVDLRRLVGGALRGVWQPERQRVILGIADELLLIVPRGPDARLHSVDRRPPNPDRPFSFQGACRAHLRGPLTALEQVDGDRIVDLWFGAHRLHVRLTGRGGGLWLLGPDGAIAAYDGPADGLPSLPALPPRPDAPRFRPEAGEDWDAAARRWLGGAEATRALDELRARAHRAIDAEIDRLIRLREGLEGDLDKASTAPRFRRQADALAASLHTVRRGTSTVRLADLEDPAIVHEIALDPERPAAASLERLYAKARRLDRVGDHVLRHLDEVEGRLVALHRDRDALADAPVERLRELVHAAPERRARSTAPWHEWTGPRGERVLVGKDAKSNRRLTFQQARGRDFWMHLRERPGSHVVVPVEGDHTPPLELLLAAAQITLAHGKIPKGASADVQYTRVKHVRAIPGEIGRVILHDEKVLTVRRDPAALLGWRRS